MSIISISGKIGAGKDTVAQMIQEATNYHFEIRRFADNLKDIVCMLIGCTREQLEDRSIKSLSLQELADKGIISKEFVDLLDDD